MLEKILIISILYAVIYILFLFMITVLWHKVPDTDAITSAIVYAHFLNHTGEQAQALSLGTLNKETLFVLNAAGVDEPKNILERALPINSLIALVDHNESGQSIDDRENYTIHSVVDHHKIGDLETGYPVFLRFEPLASTNSVLYRMYREKNIEITRTIAILMLWGIVSDTLYFRSPTTTALDKQIVEELKNIAQIDDVENFALQMFLEKSDLWSLSAYDLVKNVDAKEFIFGEKRSLIACIETTNPQYCLERKDEIIETIQTIKASEGYDFILFCIIDILQEKNITIVASNIEADILKKAFGVETLDNLADLNNRISRKKTIIPPLQETLQ